MIRGLETAVMNIEKIEYVERINSLHLLDDIHLKQIQVKRGHSPIYYWFTGRHGFWKYAHPDMTLFFCRHPNAPDDFLVFLPFVHENTTPESLETVASFLVKLALFTKRIQLARIPSELAPQLISGLNQFSALGITYTQLEEDRLDWRYPLHILSTQMTGKEPVTWQLPRFRQGLNQLKPHFIVSKPFDVSEKEVISAFFYEWAQLRNMPDIEEAVAPYQALLSLLVDEINQLGSLLFYKDEKLVGISVWETCTPTMALLHTNIANVFPKGLPHFLIRETCAYLYDTGIEYVNLGGSETPGLDQFKKSFGPFESVSLCSIDCLVQAPLGGSV
jgi:hypothetical protein